MLDVLLFAIHFGQRTRQIALQPRHGRFLTSKDAPAAYKMIVLNKYMNDTEN
jgi:hypothetical protein